MQKILLKNSLPILYEPMPHVHSVTIGLYIRAGSGYETASSNGITHFLEHLLFRRSANLTMDELYYRMESIGSTLRAVTYNGYLKFSMKIHPMYINECVAIFSSVLSETVWTNEDIEQERKVVLNQILEQSDFPDTDTLCRELTFGASAMSYPIIGTKENVSAFTADQLMRYRRQIFCHENMALCVTGCIDQEQLKALSAAFESIPLPSGQKNQRSFIPEKAFMRKNSYMVVPLYDDRIDIQLAFDVDCRQTDIGMLNLLNCILGEGVGSRLQRVLREQEGVTADIYSYISAYEDFATLSVCYSVQKSLFQKSLSLIVSVLNECKHSICERDLAVTVPFYTTNTVFDEDDSEKMNDRIGYLDFILGQPYGALRLKNDADTIRQVTQTASNVFTTKNINVALVGDNRKISRKSVYAILAELDSQ